MEKPRSLRDISFVLLSLSVLTVAWTSEIRMEMLPF